MTDVFSLWNFVPYKRDFRDMGDGMGWMRCPGCGKDISVSEPGYILVNANIKRKYPVPGMWVPDERCGNPTCRWSELNEN